MKKFAIICGYREGESYGLLGPQMAATLIEDYTLYRCIVIGVTHGDNKKTFKKALYDYFGSARPLVGFSGLNGREDLFLLARELKEEGAVTIMAGPQADVDFVGETGSERFTHRFQGLRSHFTFALHGPAEQIFPFLKNPSSQKWQDLAGAVYVRAGGEVVKNPRQPWNGDFLGTVRWDNFFRIAEGGVVPFQITAGQVLQHIGCPHARRLRHVAIDYPFYLDPEKHRTVDLSVKGCSFCDVSVDKGFCGTLGIEAVLSQIRSLPEREDGKKIPFELINENAVFGLPRLIRHCRDRGLLLSEIQLTLRADWLVAAEKFMIEALQMARKLRMRILLASVGFESFDDRILKNLNKGLTMKKNLAAVALMRRLKRLFPFQWAYATGQGAVHGLIHPTPWDSPETEENFRRITALYGLDADVLPPHSTPLIIHHASALADWIREIEHREALRFARYVSTIGWWPEARVP